MKISIFFGTALGTRIFEHLYLSAGPLCGWPGYIDGYFCLCVYMHKPRRASLLDGYCLFVADRCSLLTRLKAQWKERLFVEIPLFATRLLRWSPLLRVIVHGVTSIDWTDWNRQKIFTLLRLYSSDSFILLILAGSRSMSAWPDTTLAL